MKRIQKQQLVNQLNSSKTVLVSGPRLAGKEELIQEVLVEINLEVLQLNLENKKERKIIRESSLDELRALFSAHQLVVIHEAQYLENLQLIIEDVLAGNSKATLLLNCSFEPQIDELLKEVLILQGLYIQVLPPAFYELAAAFGLPEEEKLLEQRLIFGNYPSVIAHLDSAQEILSHLLDTIIVTDLGVTDRINKGDKLLRMLQILAFSIGTPVSYNEVGEKCDLDNETVERYIALLEKASILIKIPSYSTEKRYELKKSNLIYFVDNGVRNMLINNFNPHTLRNDLDELWKNWLISEKLKWNNMHDKKSTFWFWRTHTKQMIDLLEEQENGQCFAYKTTWQKKKKIKFPQLFQTYYPEISQHTLNRSTYWGFLTKK